MTMSDDRAFSNDLQQTLATRTVITQRQMRLVKLLELNAPELDEAVEKELIDNPALAAEDESPEDYATTQRDDTPYYRRSINNNSPDDYTPEFSPADRGDSLYEFVLRQIAESNVSEKVEAAAQYLAGSLDSDGYIRRPIDKIIEDMEFNHGLTVDKTTVEDALALIKTLDPAGVGASDLRESLILQLQRLEPSQTRDDALQIVDNRFSELRDHHYPRIVSSLHITQTRLRDALDLIQTLNASPGGGFDTGSDSYSNTIIPDYIVENQDGRLSISLNNRYPELHIEQSFADAYDELKRRSEKRMKRKGNEFIIDRYNNAADFIAILRQRQETMMSVMTAIVQLQYDYFISEDVDKMKPMMIKDIENLTGLDASTISRATSNKYVDTPWGIFPLRHFFSDTIGNNDDPLTNRRIEAEITKIVDSEDKKHPLSDEMICRRLQEKGFDVSRRTVAKYRDNLQIPISRLRKEL